MQPQYRDQGGFLGSFLSKGLKTNQLVVNTDEKTLRPIARLKEPRDLFALPKDKDNDCSQQAPRWPIECQVIEERIRHIHFVPQVPEPLNQSTGNELKPRPVGEENGIVVYSYNPISAVNYNKNAKKKPACYESSDSDESSSDSPADLTPCCSTPAIRPNDGPKTKTSVSKLFEKLNQRSSSNSNDDDDEEDEDEEEDDDDDDDDDEEGGEDINEAKEIIKKLIRAAKKKNKENKMRLAGGGSIFDCDPNNSNDPKDNSNVNRNLNDLSLILNSSNTNTNSNSNVNTNSNSNSNSISNDIEDIWANKSPEYNAATPNFILSQFGKDIERAKQLLLDNGPMRPVTPVRITDEHLTRIDSISMPPKAQHPQQSSISHSHNHSNSHSDTDRRDSRDNEIIMCDQNIQTNFDFICDTLREDGGGGDSQSSGKGSITTIIAGKILKNSQPSEHSGKLEMKAESHPAETVTLGPDGTTIIDFGINLAADENNNDVNLNNSIKVLHMPKVNRKGLTKSTARTQITNSNATPAPAPPQAQAPAHDDDNQLYYTHRTLHCTPHQQANKAHKHNQQQQQQHNIYQCNHQHQQHEHHHCCQLPYQHPHFCHHRHYQYQQQHSHQHQHQNQHQQQLAQPLQQQQCNHINQTGKPNVNVEECPSQPQFSRSAVGGSKFLTACHQYNPEEYDGLEFESRFESGNLAKAVQITQTYYELYLRPDLYTSRSKQWFYFRVRRTRRNLKYRFSIVNLVKSDSLYNDGMRPLMYSTINAKDHQEGWRRCGDNICYYRNDDDNNSNEDEEDNSSYTLTFTIEFPNDNDTVYFAHSYPYTYSDLQDYLMEIQRHPAKSKYCKLRLLCRTLAGNNVYYLTVTAPSPTEEAMKRKKSIVVSARVHPSETPSSWMMKGLMDFITGDTNVAKRLRHKFIFKLIPMLNPDGVIVGNTRNSLTGKDLNRQYRTVIRETYPSIWYTKAMIRRLIEECGVAMYCDMHAHSRKHNIFIYGCENKRNPEKKLTEQVFPLMLHKNVADRFSFESCKFKIQRSKEGTGRIVVWMLGITNSYTIEASFGGSSLGSRKGTHFNVQDYEHMGRAFCETLLDYCDENPNKVKKQAKLFKQIKKIRKREKREQKALKLKKMAEQERLRSKIIERLMKEGSSADEPLNIPLSDYSSDEGNCSSSSDNEGKRSITASDLEGPCCAPTKAPPSSPEYITEIRRFRVKRMRKVMRELDRIYFTPLFQRKFKAILRMKRRLQRVQKKRLKAGQETPPKRKRRLGSKSSSKSTNTIVQKSKSSVKSKGSTHGLTKTAGGGGTGASSGGGGQGSGLNAGPASNSANQQQQQQLTNQTSMSTTSSSYPNDEHLFKTKSKVGGRKVKKVETPLPKMPRRKIKINRKFRLWLANRQIIIYRRKVRRRSRLHARITQRKRTEIQRTPLDMPTTDPGSDLHFSTDDEQAVGPQYGTVPRMRRSLLQSDLQRRYIEEMGDALMKQMPPELIVTSPSKSGKMETYRVTPQTTPEIEVRREQAGSNLGSARRTYSWHNMNHTKRLIPKRIVSPFVMNQQSNNTTPDDLQLKLSLKKKIWTGTHGEPNNPNMVDRTRPLSWYMPPVSTIGGGGGGAAANPGAGGTGGGIGINAKKEKSIIGGHSTGATRKGKKINNVDILNACSKKLILWQQEEANKHVAQPSSARTKTDTVTTHLNVPHPATAAEDQTVRIFKHMSISKRTQKTNNNIKALEHTPDVKIKRKNTRQMSKIAETSQIIARLSRNKMHGSGHPTILTSSGHQRNNRAYRANAPMTAPTTARANSGHNATNAGINLTAATAAGGGGGNSSAHGHQLTHNKLTSGGQRTKFKTGGIVVTAVQPGVSEKRNKKQRSMGGGGGGGTAGIITGVMRMQSNVTSLTKNKEKCGDAASSNAASIGLQTSIDSASFVRKVKTKLKKRKTRPNPHSNALAACNVGANMPSGGGAGGGILMVAANGNVGIHGICGGGTAGSANNRKLCQ